MTSTEITYIILFSLPAYVAMMCGLYLSRMAYLKENPFGIRPFFMTIILYFISMLVWFSQILYFVLPEVYVTLNAFIFLTCLLIYVFSYRFVFEITKVSMVEKFPYYHFLTPFLGFAVMLALSFLVPRDVQLSIVRSGGSTVDGYKWFSLFFEAGIPIMLCMNVIYSLLGLRRIGRYHKVVVNYSADEYRGALTWLYHYIFSSLAFFAGIGFLFIISKITPVNPWFLLIPLLIAVFKYVILLHNILLENFIIISIDSTELSDSSQSLDEMVIPPEVDTKANIEAEAKVETETETEVEANVETEAETIKNIEALLLLSTNENESQPIKSLNSYMLKKKPFLNPKFKITDMCSDLQTNRTTLSALINRTYGMNFSRFINLHRLNELYLIKSKPVYKKLSEEELVMKAGFSDYRGYFRVRFREETKAYTIT